MDGVNQNFICKPHLKWKCPPKIASSHNRHMAAGEESTEVETQQKRRRKIYRRPSYIRSRSPPPLKVQQDVLDDSQILMIPIEECEPPEENDASLGVTKVSLRNSPAAAQYDTLSQINDEHGGRRSTRMTRPPVRLRDYAMN